MTSRYGVAPGGNCANNSDDAGFAVDSLGEVELGVDDSSGTAAHSTIGTVVGTIPSPGASAVSPSSTLAGIR
jgi:hypothetical protein